MLISGSFTYYMHCFLVNNTFNCLLLSVFLQYFIASQFLKNLQMKIYFIIIHYLNVFQILLIENSFHKTQKVTEKKINVRIKAISMSLEMRLFVETILSNQQKVLKFWIACWDFLLAVVLCFLLPFSWFFFINFFSARVLCSFFLKNLEKQPASKQQKKERPARFQ